jgi:hypothetical protein
LGFSQDYGDENLHDVQDNIEEESISDTLSIEIDDEDEDEDNEYSEINNKSHLTPKDL